MTIHTLLNLAAVALLLCVPALPGCGGPSPVFSQRLAADTIVLPSSAPVCAKNTAELEVFVDYSSPACAASENNTDACLPGCGGSNDPACPAGSTCDLNSFKCRPTDCSASAAVCTGDTICKSIVTDGGVQQSLCLLAKCADDNHCPCGSYCDAKSGRCRLDCLPTQNVGLSCTPSSIPCDGRGRCPLPAGAVVSPFAVVVSPAPHTLLVPEDASGNFTPVSLTIQTSTTDSGLGSAGAVPPVHVTFPPALSVACNSPNPSPSPGPGTCDITGLSFVLDRPSNTYLASRVLTVQVANGNQAPSWDITLTVDGVPTPTIVKVLPNPAKQESGRYKGSLILGSGGAIIPIQATMTGTALAIHDPSHLIAPTGTALLNINSSVSSTSFLSGPAHAQLYRKVGVGFQFDNGPPAFDPQAGTLTGTFRTTLSTSSQSSESWSFALRRIADLTTAPCPTGENFDATLAACIPGAQWDSAVPSTSTSFVHARATSWLNSMAPRLGDALLQADGAEPLAERTLCYDVSTAALLTPSNNGFLNQTKSGGISGDLQCDGGTAGPHEQWGIGLIPAPDRIADPSNANDPDNPTISQFDTLAACLEGIMRIPNHATLSTDLDNNPCVSLARFYPALFTLAGSGPYRPQSVPSAVPFDQRSNLLFMRLMQEWSELAGFIARDGTAQKSASDVLSQLTGDISAPETGLVNATAGVSFASLLDTMNTAWTLLLDKRIYNPLLALPASVLAMPDYRQLKMPLDYWTFAAADRSTGVVNNLGLSGTNLAASGCTYSGNYMIGSTACVHSATLPVLANNVTLAAQFAVSPNFSSLGTIIDSDGLVVQLFASGTGNLLQFGHTNAFGGVELITIPWTLNVGHAGVFNIVVQRDVQAQSYIVTIGNTTNAGLKAYDSDLKVYHARYATAPSAPAAGQVYIGASRTNSALNMNTGLGEVAIWDSVLSPTEVANLISSLTSGPSSGLTHELWPSKVQLPLATDPNANEATVGLPALMLEGLIPTMGLIEAYLNNAALANTTACRLGNVDDVFQHTKDGAARALRLSYAIQQLADTLHTKAISLGPVTWETRYDQAISELKASRNKTIHVLTNAETCKDLMGLGPKEFPLFAGPTANLIDNRPADLLDVSASFLIGLATGANTTATTALANARTSWTQEYTAGVQQVVAGESATTRLNDISSSYGNELIDLCGVNQDSITVLGEFINPGTITLTPANCFVSSACSGAESLPFSQIAPNCLQGQIGEAIVASQAAMQRVQRAIITYNTSRTSADNWNAHCAQVQQSNNKSKDIIADETHLEQQESATSNLLGGLTAGMEIIGGVAIVAGTAGAGSLAGVPAILDGVTKLASLQQSITDNIANDKALDAQMLQDRQLDGQLQECWFNAGQAEAPIDGARQDIVVANADLQTALTQVSTLQERVASIVTEATAAVARESGRPIPRTAFHYWAQENLEIYLSAIARSRRMTYLALRAVEHDVQVNLGLDAAILGASHPAQLDSAINTLSGALANAFGGSNRAESLFFVLNLCEDVLQLPARNHTANCQDPLTMQQFHEILFSPANAIYENGQYMGQAVPFTLTPEILANVFKIGGQCAENNAQVDVVLSTLQLPPSHPTILVNVAKRESFYSTTCPGHESQVGDVFQQGRIRSSQNLLVGGTSNQFIQDQEYATAVVAASSDTDRPTFASSGTPGSTAQLSLAGRGLYGNYQFVIPAASVSTFVGSLLDLSEVRIRFDFVSVPDPTNTLSEGSTNLTTHLLDGTKECPPPANTPPIDGNECALLSGSSGVSITAVPLPSPSPGVIDTLTASAASGWHFAEWSGACAGLSPTCTVLATNPRDAWATFVNDDPGVNLTVTKNVSSSGNGGVASDWMGVTAGSQAGGSNLDWTEALADSSVVSLFALPTPDSVFTGWTGGGCSGTASPCTLTLQDAAGAKTVSATFVHKPVLTVNIVGDPNGPGQNRFVDTSVLWGPAGDTAHYSCSDTCFYPTNATCMTTCTTPLLPGQPITLTAVADPGGQFPFVSWSGACAGAAGTCNVTMSGDLSVTASFRNDTILTVNSNTRGTVTSSGINCGAGGSTCVMAYFPNSPVVSLSATPASFFAFSSWTGDAASCGTNPSCALTLNTNKNVTANWVQTSACLPGQHRSCCNCGNGCCGGSGNETCNSSGAWGACLDTTCASKGGVCP